VQNKDKPNIPFTLRLGIFRLDNLDPDEFDEIEFKRKSLHSGKTHASRYAKHHEKLLLYFQKPIRWSQWEHQGMIFKGASGLPNVFTCVKVTKQTIKFKGVKYRGYVRLIWQKKLFD